jgi:hypothetical protein
MSFLLTAAAMREVLTATGFEVVSWNDTTASANGDDSRERVRQSDDTARTMGSFRRAGTRRIQVHVAVFAGNAITDRQLKRRISNGDVLHFSLDHLF